MSYTPGKHWNNLELLDNAYTPCEQIVFFRQLHYRTSNVKSLCCSPMLLKHTAADASSGMVFSLSGILSPSQDFTWLAFLPPCQECCHSYTLMSLTLVMYNPVIKYLRKWTSENKAQGFACPIACTKQQMTTVCRTTTDSMQHAGHARHDQLASMNMCSRISTLDTINFSTKLTLAILDIFQRRRT